MITTEENFPNDSHCDTLQSEANNELSSQLLSEPLLDQNEVPNDDTSNNSNGDYPSASRLLFFRSIYFLSGLSSATWGRFAVIYYNQVKHLSSEQIGVLQGLLRLMGFVTLPLWGYVADMIQSRKKVYLFCNTMSVVSLLLLSRAQNFLTILCCVIGMASFKSSGVLDAHTLDFLGERHRGMYGTIRMMMAISWGLGAVIMGWITDKYGFDWNFGLFGGMMTTVLLLTAFGLPSKSQKEQERYDNMNRSHNDDGQEEEEEEGIVSSSPQLSTLFASIFRFPVLLWLTEVAVIGSGMSIVETFLFVHMQDDLQSTTTLCGYSVGVTVLLEVPIFHNSKYLLKEWGHDKLFMIAMIAYIIRAFGYTMLTTSTVHWVLALEIFHGITFGCMWIASVDFSARVAPEEWSTTFQSVLSMTMSCIGGGIGPIVGGIVMDHFGVNLIFQAMGVVVLCVALMHLIVWQGFGGGHDAFLSSIVESESE
ncbi:unnamed protein product [Cylindrotheca closterium]|uniref:Major facilitator superfamily associated domain-containing protein n=1 Tax=Cylindrotheca closterium TaxID=2856 RepID=A0AAD2FQ34_9STRA|nr:unnamed protein product [Cylindrotheca closterium]